MVKEKMIFARQTNGIERKYNYNLLENTIENTLVYGIEIERVDYKGKVEIDRFSDSVEVISIYEKKVKELLVMLYENGVSPIHLVDIVGEFVDKSVFDFKGTEIDNYVIV